ncbi:MAG TPA: hypothetical protein VG755_42560 [Nannocystaceae bacterium]|nr:hypothetical protein [Nannocystaceae bacterium]
MSNHSIAPVCVHVVSTTLLAVAIAGCGSNNPPDLPELCDGNDCVSGSGSSGGAVDSGPDEEDDGDDGDAPSDDGGSESGAAPSSGLPCEVLDVLQRNCHECHSAQPAFGAPMPLADYDDLQVPALSNPAEKVFERVAERLVDEVSPMPPGGTMADADMQVLFDWIDAGAPEDREAQCGDGPSGDDDGGETELPCDPDFVVTAHAAGTDDAFAVPAQGADNLYMCFAFKAPFANAKQATAWTPIIDDERVVHHWILYRTPIPQTDGGAVPCDVTLQLSTQFVAGWAPGGGDVVMPDDVGLDLGTPNDWYILQIHYNNSAHYDDARDRSGVGFCTIDEPREKTAGILTFGSLNIAVPPLADDHEVTGVCSGAATLAWPEMHLLGASPHMHELGRAMRSEITHIDGTKEMMFDAPFDFNSQGMHLFSPEIIVKPGDTITTTCTYDNPNPWPVTFGENTENEMCFDFVLAYPIQNLLSRNCGIPI